MKKKTIKRSLLVLAGVLVLGGCGIQGENEPKDTLVNGNLTAENNTEATAESNTGSSAESNTEGGTANNAENTLPGTDEKTEEKQKAPIIAVTSDKKEWYTEDGTILLMEAEESLVTVENEGFDALKTALEKRFSSIEDGNYQNMIEDAREDYNWRDAELKEYFYGYSSSEQAEVARCDGRVVSLRVFYHDYCGGAHGMYAYGGATFDTATGEELQLSDVVTNTAGFYAKAADYIGDELWRTYEDGLWPEYRDIVAESFQGDVTLNWYLNGTGIVIAYTPYELGPYAMGAPEVTLPYEEFAEFLNSAYLPSTGETFVQISENADVSGILGEEKPIYVQTQLNEYDMVEVTVVSGNAQSVVGEFGWFCDAYALKRADGRSFLLVVCDYMSDDKVTFVYEVTDGKATKCDELNRAEVTGGYLTADQIEMSVYLDVLGTYTARMKYHLDMNGKLSQAEEVFAINGAMNLAIVRELPVMLEGAENLLQPGIEIRITGTNNVDEAYFVIPDTDQTGVITYGFEDLESPWIHTINGVSEYEYFEMIPYAG